MASVESNDDYYAVLEISNTATLEVVNQSFRRLAKIRHPDKLREGGSTAAFQLASLIHLVPIQPPQTRAATDFFLTEASTRL